MYIYVLVFNSLQLRCIGVFGMVVVCLSVVRPSVTNVLWLNGTGRKENILHE